jgi:hypothetical protein
VLAWCLVGRYHCGHLFSDHHSLLILSLWMLSFASMVLSVIPPHVPAWCLIGGCHMCGGRNNYSLFIPPRASMVFCVAAIFALPNILCRYLVCLTPPPRFAVLVFSGAIPPLRYKHRGHLSKLAFSVCRLATAK